MNKNVINIIYSLSFFLVRFMESQCCGAWLIRSCWTNSPMLSYLFSMLPLPSLSSLFYCFSVPSPPSPLCSPGSLILHQILCFFSDHEFIRFLKNFDPSGHFYRLWMSLLFWICSSFFLSPIYSYFYFCIAFGGKFLWLFSLPKNKITFIYTPTHERPL